MYVFTRCSLHLKSELFVSFVRLFCLWLFARCVTIVCLPFVLQVKVTSATTRDRCGVLSGRLSVLLLQSQLRIMYKGGLYKYPLTESQSLTLTIKCILLD